MIAVLAPHVIDQIAAGEVIERPASVVKELVDNAIDAGASAIAIEVAAGGRTLVRVSDDGCGMTAKDAVLSLERHATSKLREVDDLWSLASMGFRGEALPSIASVSRMTLTTRRAGDDAATRIVVEGGRLVSVTDAGAPVGTTVEVADLLYNVPARLKFLKGEATEASHVTELVGKLAMAYPRLHFRLKHNGRTALDAPPDRDGLARAQALLGPRIAARMVPVSGEESAVRVTAYLGAPELAQATARGVQLFVGRRPVRDRGLLQRGPRRQRPPAEARGPLRRPGGGHRSRAPRRASRRYRGALARRRRRRCAGAPRWPDGHDGCEQRGCAGAAVRRRDRDPAVRAPRGTDAVAAGAARVRRGPRSRCTLQRERHAPGEHGRPARLGAPSARADPGLARRGAAGGVPPGWRRRRDIRGELSEPAVAR
ncbi:MAG: hypothetical protein E6J91_34195 [Deltaproteobacteria bacterium]|nr:MAG: hypothetical protein E6J91_34195 [Deltaproteobacteria bacterium]